ncbi:hypothetical protein ACFQI7_27965 [Paenibacillus allorhizosphaerae]|nr:hypothetical protein [Paenibacillus allorhizosphaerae]
MEEDEIADKSERARAVLSKGIRKKRFRRLRSWEVKNRYLLGLLFAEDLKISDFAEQLGASHRAVNAWIYEGVLPGRERRKKAADILRCPEEVLFMEPMSEYRKIGKKIPD